MNRRRFLHLLTMAASAVAVSPYWTPTPELVEPPAPPAVAFDPSAFTLFDRQVGVSIRFIGQADINKMFGQVNRIDVLYGYGIIPGHENMAIRVTSEGTGARARRRAKRQKANRVPLENQFSVQMGDLYTVKGINA